MQYRTASASDTWRKRSVRPRQATRRGRPRLSVGKRKENQSMKKILREMSTLMRTDTEDDCEADGFERTKNGSTEKGRKSEANKASRQSIA